MSRTGKSAKLEDLTKSHLFVFLLERNPKLAITSGAISFGNTDKTKFLFFSMHCLVKLALLHDIANAQGLLAATITASIIQPTGLSLSFAPKTYKPKLIL